MLYLVATHTIKKRANEVKSPVPNAIAKYRCLPPTPRAAMIEVTVHAMCEKKDITRKAAQKFTDLEMRWELPLWKRPQCMPLAAASK